jgi:hypothetical protein
LLKAQAVIAGRAFRRQKRHFGRRQIAGNRIMLGSMDWLYVPLSRMEAAE